MGVSTVCDMFIRGDDGDVKDKLRSGRPRTAASPSNEERFDQLNRSNHRVMIRELCTEIDTSFNPLETMMAKLEHIKMCAENKTTFSCHAPI